MIRASLSVTAIFAEGYGRHHHQQNLQDLRQARGSLYETLEHIHTARDENYITSEFRVAFRDEILVAIKILSGSIRYIGRRELG